MRLSICGFSVRFRGDSPLRPWRAMHKGRERAMFFDTCPHRLVTYGTG
jgi:hypothetical protein